MKILYDHDTDSASIFFHESKIADGNEEISENIYLMYDKNNTVIGLEIMGNASRILDMMSGFRPQIITSSPE